MTPPRRLTQQDIARMAGVSQTTVSMVLNNRTDTEVRISPETRERVLRVIRETGYIADPAARRLAERRNRIIGVFTYEAVFPSASADFYHPFLLGIEERAEDAGCDLLLFTSAKAASGERRRIFNADSRVRLADGCVLLGRTVDRDDLARLLAEGFPFISIGRRDDAGGPVPYVGVDYPPAVRALVERVKALGHTRLAYVGAGEGGESRTDRMRGFREAAGPRALHLPVGEGGHARILDELSAAGVTAVFVEEPADGTALTEAAKARGLSIPDDLSILVLGTPDRRPGFTGFSIPRREIGWRAVELLTDVLERGGTPQELLPCEPVEGTTLAAPRNRKA
ncbi:LacI family DNA-binding transcriptional regulator [Actinomadura sp. 6N118]|uniref:LacI family DNA-binding transcriptional regulator n=1 Tax=Actinomadura sp. 6N118 TaxID=3375151 RepID=UPI003796AAB5